MNYAVIKKTDVANGIGIRVSLFVSGCTHRCKGCFNSEAWDFGYGRVYTEETKREIMDALKHPYIRGFSILGGEPFEPENRLTVLDIARSVREAYPDKDVWCYTGYDYEKELMEWIADGRTEVKELLEQIDVLVDGEFIEERKNLRLPFRGSENQRIIDVKASLASGRLILLDAFT
ncbi:MAG: anaerobic ribonucleoside-triphosphate reductase activating protein [Lachnospiraceae bacterium]|nr:anaerobic ribonucleoside-triphosphate reductase activating protein [Lachnospiraceae bacterium]